VINSLRNTAKADGNIDRRIKAIWGLGKSDAKFYQAREVLIELSKSNNSLEIRKAAIDALGSYPGSKTISALNYILKNENTVSLKTIAVESLYSCFERSVLSSFLIALEDKDKEVGKVAIEKLVDICKTKLNILNWIFRQLDIQNRDVTSKLLETLAKIAMAQPDEKVVQKICLKLREFEWEPNKKVRVLLAITLRNCDTELSNKIFKSLLSDSDLEIKNTAQEYLDELGIE
jgi:HEAT repeat protein